MHKQIISKIILGSSLLIAVLVTVVLIVISFTNHTYKSNGIWEGIFDIDGRGKYNFTALYFDGNAVAVSEDTNILYQGKISIDDNQYHSNMNMYIINKGFYDTVDLHGTLSQMGIKLVLSLKRMMENEKVNCILNIKSIYFEKPATLEKITGEWDFISNFQYLEYTIKEDGIITGADTLGCEYKGTIQPLHGNFNVYSVQILITSCYEKNTQMGGMAYLKSDLSEDDTLVMHLFDKEWSLFMPIVRNDDTRLIDRNKEWNGTPPVKLETK